MPRSRTSMFARSLSALALLASAGTAHAQPVQFQRSIGFTSAEIAYEVAPTSDGGSVTVGRTSASPTTPADIYVVKYDDLGNDVWSRVISSVAGGNEVGYSITQTADGGYIIGAETNSVSSQFGIALVKLDSVGALVWSRVYLGTPFLDSPAGVQVKELEDGSIVVVGRHAFGVPGVGISGVMLRVDAAGNMIFLNRYAEVGATIDGGGVSFADFAQLDDGFMVAGWMTDSTGGPRQTFLMKTTPAGAPVWARTYSAGGVDVTADSIVLTDNQMSTIGRYGTGNAFTLRFNMGGALAWNRIIGGFTPGFAAGLAGPDDTTIFAGTAVNPTNAAQIRIDPAGALVSGVRYGDALAATRGHDISSLSCRTGYGLTGSTTMTIGNGQEDVHLLSTDVDGRTGCREMDFAPGMTFTSAAVGIRTVSATSDMQSISWNVTIANRNSGNIRYCLEVGCTADLNGDGLVDFADYLEFLNLYDAECPCVDYTGDGIIDFSDYLEFLNHYDSGC